MNFTSIYSKFKDKLPMSSIPRPKLNPPYFQHETGLLRIPRITKKRRENLATLKESTSTFYLYRSALVRERTTEEGRDNVHNTVGDIGLQCNILVGSHQNYFGHIG
jgi:hypothetical protein